MAPVWLVPAAGAERAMSPVSPRAGSPALGSLERTGRGVPTPGEGVACSRGTSRSVPRPPRGVGRDVPRGAQPLVLRPLTLEQRQHRVGRDAAAGGDVARLHPPAVQ